MEEVTNAVLLQMLEAQNRASIVQREENQRQYDEIKNEVKEVKVQTKITNGSVAGLKLNQAYFKGALALLSAIVVPILFMFISKFIE